MNPCFYSSHSKFSYVFVKAVGLVAGLLALFCGVYLIIDFEYVVSGLCLIVVLIAAVPNFIQLWRYIDRKYLISAEGIYLNDKGKDFYSWDNVHGIGIYAFEANTGLTICRKVICCFLSPPQDNIREILLTNKGSYAEKNQDKVLILEYSDELYEELASVYPREIPDHYTGSCPYGEWVKWPH